MHCPAKMRPKLGKSHIVEGAAAISLGIGKQKIWGLSRVTAKKWRFLETIFMGSFATVQVWLMLNKALRFFQRSSSLSRTVRRSLWQKKVVPDYPQNNFTDSETGY